jgi:hypothetical protein
VRLDHLDRLGCVDSRHLAAVAVRASKKRKYIDKQR